jgi:hypothetical protein
MTEERLKEIELWPEHAGNYGSGEADEFIPELLAEVHALRAELEQVKTATAKAHNTFLLHRALLREAKGHLAWGEDSQEVEELIKRIDAALGEASSPTSDKSFVEEK